jgi:hypothetical protein
MMQPIDYKPGAYYVTVRDSAGPEAKTVLALGPFRRHRRALGLVTTVRRRFSRAGLDNYHSFAYGTSRAELRDGLEEGAFNEVFHVATDIKRPTSEPHVFGAGIYTALERA